MRFQIAELSDLALVEGELDELHAEHSRLANVDQLAQGIQAILDSLYGNEAASAYSLIAGAARELGVLTEHDPTLEEQLTQLNAAEIELRDIATALTRYQDKLEPDPHNPRYILTVYGVGYRFTET